MKCLGIALGVALLTGCGGATDADPAPAAATALTAVVDVATVERRSIERAFDAIGTLRASEHVTVSAEVPGVIAAIEFEAGGTIPEADPDGPLPVLFRLDDELLELAVGQAQAMLEVAAATVAEQAAKAEREARLFTQKATTSAAVADAELELQTARAREAQAAVAVRLAQAQLAKATIRAPFVGRLGARMVGRGDFVQPGQGLVELVALDPIEVEFSVPQRHRSEVATGLGVTLTADAWPDRTFAGAAHFVAPAADARTRTLRLRARLPNGDGALTPGAFVRVRLIVGAAVEALVVPESAIVPRGDRFLVYVVTNGRAESREVTLGQRLAGAVVVRQGVAANESVIVSGLQRVSDGGAVTVRSGR